MERYILELTINEIPKSLNITLQTHHLARYEINKYWYRFIHNMTLRTKPNKPLEKAKLTFVRHFWRMLDFDSVCASMKPIADGLERSGIIAKDSWKVTGKWDVDQKFRLRKLGPLLYLKVEEITSE